MPVVPFDALPADARVWVFAAADPVHGDRENLLLQEVDGWLEGWQAHGVPLTCAREWREGRFLAIGVDQSSAGASGCSIDSLFHRLLELQAALGTSLLGGGRVFYRDARGDVRAASRVAFPAMAAAGTVGGGTPVFDTTVTTAAAYRNGFERPLRESWHRDLVTPA